MRYALALASLAAVALSAPYNNPVQEVQNIHWVVETIVETVYVTEAQAQATPVAQQPQYQATPVSTPAQATPAPAAPAAPASYGTGYMATVNKWRAAMGLKSLTQDSHLEANALKCVTESNGQMIHELNPGTYGQVLAPGGADEFEHVFVGGWICERPELLGASGNSICAVQDQGWDHQGQTGHADILSSGSYSKIGCARYAGIWGCDLA